MNKFLLSSMLGIASLSPLAASLAYADDSQGGVDTNQLDNFFVSGNLGKSDYRNGYNKDNGVYQSLTAGWRWNGIVGPEVGYAFLGRPRDQGDDGSSTRLKSQAALLGVNAKYDFYGNWYVTGHAGYLRARVRASDSFDGAKLTNTRYDNSWYGGVGVGYDVTQNVSVGINYDNYRVKYDSNGGGSKTNIAAYSANVQYRF